MFMQNTQKSSKNMNKNMLKFKTVACFYYTAVMQLQQYHYVTASARH